MHKNYMQKTALIILLAFSLTGCGSPWLDETFYNSAIIQHRDYAPFGPNYYPAPIYCYKTLAGAECFSEPQNEMSRQFIAAYTPPPCKLVVKTETWEETYTTVPNERAKPIPLSAATAWSY